MSREPHGPVRRLSMLVVAVPFLAVGLWLLYNFWPEELVSRSGGSRYRRHQYSSDVTPAGLGAALTSVGVAFIYTALTPYRRRTEEEEDAEGEYDYSWRDRARLRQWGDD